ncbi:hypothetical protein [Flavobacterium sp. YO12]|uniref:hypothetical protein n=1 Tax=Flavobacterium sp. YO12 TaxID=1920029 RepID=UPI00100A2F60|nr:hypothetical protein [Flavobacterium sp. YO12]RXM43917.1 hypothetical protein BOW55_18405 [Flavobacterium sp. YO12]
MKHEFKGDAGEEYVNELAYGSYLKYWCYPNPKDLNGDKKEICDLLILFREAAIIFSVKNHSFDGNYERYKKRVVEKSSNQLNGAFRKLFGSSRQIHIKHPDRDPEPFNPGQFSKIYRLTVNVGEQFEHYEFSDQDDRKGFISILNKDTFEAIMEELDTIKDFIGYLDEREKLLASGKNITINCTEKDLLAEFLMNKRSFKMNYKAEHVKEIQMNLSGSWNKYEKSEQLLRKRKADEISYFIDKMVKRDILHLPEGETLARELMNLGRTERRMLTKSLFDLVKKHEGEPDTFARRYSAYNGIGHLLIYYPADVPEEETDSFIQLAMALYAYKTAYREKEIICIAATDGVKQHKFGMFQAFPPIPAETARLYDSIISDLGWFTSMQVLYYEEKEYPDAD